MNPSFNVLNEPWIPVIHMDGTSEEMGILSCLQKAQYLLEIRDPAPIIEFGIYRLLVAFVLDALISQDSRPEDPLDIKSIIEDKHFNSEMIERYIEKCGDVFDLFHPERPFLQTNIDNAKPKPIAALFPVTPSGTNVIHWHHYHEENVRVTIQEAARLLTTVAPFMTAGGAGLSPSINGAPAIYAMPLGNNLFETIVLNIPLRNEQDAGDGVVAWKSKRSPGQNRSQATTVEALTWRPRKIQLVPEFHKDNSVTVREMKFEKGDSTRLTWIDANLAYTYDKAKTTPIRMREGRPLWRDAGLFLLLKGSEHGKAEKKVSFRRPDVVEQAFSCTDSGNELVVQVFGMRTDMKMKVFEWAKSTWSVPARLGRSTRLGSLVQQELERAENAAYGLRKSIKVLYPRGGMGNKKALGTIVDRCERSYWQSLELVFHPLMSSFAKLDPDAPDNPNLIATTARDWRDTIRNLAREHFELTAQDMDSDSDALERQVRARARLNNTLRKVLS
jgi:CRISPR system Cascade subunit CasA